MSEIPVNTILCGDCLNILKDFPDGCVDLVCTDPQYEEEAHTAVRRTRATIEGRQAIVAMPFAKMDDSTRERFCFESVRLSCGWVLAFCQAEAVGKYQELFGLAWRRPMVWVKPDAAPQFTGDKPAMGYESICAAWAGEGKSSWNGGGRRGVFSVNCTDYEHLHPTQKPLGLMLDFVELFSNPGDLILDPFCGSGTTCVAAKMLGRNYIGIDISPEYCAIARERLKAVDTGVPVKEAKVGQMALFTEAK